MIEPSAEIAIPLLSPLPTTPAVDVSTRVVVDASRSRRNTRCMVAVSPATRFVAVELKATNLPSAETRAAMLAPSAGVPSGATLTRVVVFEMVSRTKMWARLIASSARLDVEGNATSRPSAETEADLEIPLPCAPALLTLTRTVESRDAAAADETSPTVSAPVSPSAVTMAMGGRGGR